jgi:DHA2 family multidrug resistance protein-like MFS transporter
MFLDERERTVAITVWMTSFSVGGAIGPLVGGVLLEHFWWGSVFVPNVPVMLLLLVLGPVLLPEYKDPAAGRLDPTSAGLSLGAVLAFIYGLKRFAETGADAVTVVAVIGGIVLGTLFVSRQRRIAYPFLDLSLFRRREFGAALTMNLLVIVALFGLFFLVSQYLQLVLGLSPLQAGLVFVPASLAFILGSAFVPGLSRRFRPSTLIAGGLLLAAPGLFAMTGLGTASGALVVVFGTVLYQIALTPVFTLSTAIVVGSAPPERAGAAAAISETSYELGGALGVATLGTLGTFLYRARLLEKVGPEAPAELVAAAKGTLGAAVASAARFGEADAARVLEPAKEAFVASVHSIAYISAGIFVFLSVFVAVLLRDATLEAKH